MTLDIRSIRKKWHQSGFSDQEIIKMSMSANPTKEIVDLAAHIMEEQAEDHKAWRRRARLSQSLRRLEEARKEMEARKKMEKFATDGEFPWMRGWGWAVLSAAVLAAFLIAMVVIP